ncbi:MAG: C39 family peptidase [Lachnospiraceae bacterium]|nr:C39 family peptidase [Lachnospiraceae bacterium]
MSNRKIIQVPYIDQSMKYPTGCESVSTVMLLQYLGYDISVDEFIADYLEMKDFEEREGQLFGADPNLYFCGSPYDKDSFGCYAPVICKALEKAVGDKYDIINETDTPTEELIKKYIDADIPVIFWACINMREPIVGPEWRLLDSEEIFTWISNEHCMLLVGYDEKGYYFNDPHENRGLIHYDKELVENRHRAQYSMAVGVSRKNK